MRWLIVFVLTCLVWNGLQPWLERIGLGRVPGDFSVRIGRRRNPEVMHLRGVG